MTRPSRSRPRPEAAAVTRRAARAVIWAGLSAATLALAACGEAPGPIAPGPQTGAERERVTPVPESREEIILSFAPVVERTAPAVVNVYTVKEVRRTPRDPFFADPFFRFFFEGPGRRPAPRERLQNSLGSGVIVRGDGLIVTNYHVIEDADAIMVVLADRREFAAELLGADPTADLALLRIDPRREALPALHLGDSDALKVGDLVLAIGNPFGIGQTVTSGIISAVARTAPGLGSGMSFLQTDAAINPGNSRGALITIDGRLAGINTAIFTRGGGSIGIGFAIPANLVRALIRSVESGEGGLPRPWFGAAVEAVTPEVADALGLARPAGVLVGEVHPDGPAARAGLARGNVVLALDGVEVQDPRGLEYRLALGEIGRAVPLQAWRRGERLTLELPLERPPFQPPPAITRLDGRHVLSGATVANLSPGFNLKMGLDPLEHGVVVVEVERGSPAARLGLRPGDVLASVVGHPVADVAALEEELSRSGQLTRLEIERGGRRLEAVLG